MFHVNHFKFCQEISINLKVQNSIKVTLRDHNYESIMCNVVAYV